MDKTVAFLCKHEVLTLAGRRAPRGGRPPASYAFNPLIKVCVGVDLGMPRVSLLIADLDGNPLWESNHAESQLSDPKRTLGTIGRLVASGLRKLKFSRSRVLGLGLGLPAFVNGSEDTVSIQGRNLPSWKNVPVKRALSQQLGIPIYVDNDVNFMAVAESVYRAPQEPVLLYLALRSGTNQDLRMGSAILLEGQVFRGANGNAASLQGMYVELRRQGDLLGTIQRMLTRQRLEGVLMRALQEHFFLPAVNMILMLDPSLVVVHAPLLNSEGEAFIKLFKRTLQKHLPSPMAQQLRIEASTHTHRPGASGAARFVAQRAFAEPKELIARLSS